MPDRNPYVGPRPFSADDADRFFGRDAEAREVLSLILAHPVTVVYSESGAGKTSLLNAKIIPGLLERDCEVIGPVRVCADFAEDLIPREILNVFTLSALLMMDRDSADLSKFTRLTLREYLDIRPKPPRPHAIRPPRVLIFDQFEELFTSRPERWQDRAAFIDDIGAALAADRRLRVVFSLREEFLASLDALASELTEGLRNRFRLERLRKPTALDAIEKPLEGTGVAYAPGVADALADNLLRIQASNGKHTMLAEFAEPVHLQLVCHRIWSALPPGTTTITTDDIETLGDVDAALTMYYDECIAKVAMARHRSEAQLRTWFQKNFITADGSRGLVYRTVRDVAGMPHDVVDAFQALYLVRAESRGGSRWYELTHDRMIAPILASNARWRLSQRAGRLSIDALEVRATEWRDGGRPAVLLLSDSDFLDAKNLLCNGGDELAASESVSAFVEASDVARERRRGKRFRRRLLAGVVAGLALVAIFLRMWMVERDRAQSIERRAMAEIMIKDNAMGIDGLLWALRAYAKVGARDYLDIVRSALSNVGLTLWLRRPGAPVQNALFSPNGTQVLTISDRELCVWNTVDGAYRADQAPPPGRIWRDAFFSRSGTYVIAHHIPDPGERRKYFRRDSDMDPKRFVIWEWADRGKRTLTQLNGIPRHEDVSISKDDTTLAVAYRYRPAAGGTLLEPSTRARWVRLFDLKRGVDLRAIQSQDPVHYISLSPSGKRLVAVSFDFVRIWDTETARLIRQLEQPVTEENVPIVKWTEKGDSLFLGFQSPTNFSPVLISFGDRLTVVPLKIDKRVLDAWFSSDGSLIVKVDNQNRQRPEVRAHRFSRQGTRLESFPEESIGMNRDYARYFKEGVVASLSDNANRSAAVLSVYRANGTPLDMVTLPGLHQAEVTSFSSTGQHLLTVADGVARLWNVNEVRRLARLRDAEMVLDASCSRFANQPELREILERDGVCRARTPVSAAAGGM